MLGIPKGLKKISPLWYDRLVKAPNLRSLIPTKVVGERLLDIGEPFMCVVGEAYCFKSDYECSCPTCYDFCMNIWRNIGGSTVKHSSNGLRKELKEFVKHFEEDHNDI